jgi:hypothetical protein
MAALDKSAGQMHAARMKYYRAISRLDALAREGAGLEE